MTAELTADELAVWEADYAIAPWGEVRGDIQAGLLAQCTVPIGRKPPPLSAFLVGESKADEPQQTEAEAKLQCDLAAAAWPGATVTRRKCPP